MTSGRNRVEHLTWDAVAARIASGAAAILPIGAGAKQHGWHLPMGSDHIQADWLAARLAGRIDALIWPPLTYGHYPAFIAYAGSVSLSAGLFEALVREIVGGLRAFGPRVLVLDTGISTNTPVARALVGLDRIAHLKVYEGPRYRAAAASLTTQAHGQHADELETSCLLAIAPDRVAMARAAAGSTEPPGPGPMQHADPAGTNFSASGSIGDPTAASREAGGVLLAAMLDDIAEAANALL